MMYSFLVSDSATVNSSCFVLDFLTLLGPQVLLVITCSMRAIENVKVLPVSGWLLVIDTQAQSCNADFSPSLGIGALGMFELYSSRAQTNYN